MEIEKRIKLISFQVLRYQVWLNVVNFFYCSVQKRWKLKSKTKSLSVRLSVITRNVGRLKHRWYYLFLTPLFIDPILFPFLGLFGLSYWKFRWYTSIGWIWMLSKVPSFFYRYIERRFNSTTGKLVVSSQNILTYITHRKWRTVHLVPRKFRRRPNES